MPPTQEEVARITDAMRRVIRLKNMVMATEETYVHWSARFTRFCLIKLKNPPQTPVCPEARLQPSIGKPSFQAAAEHQARRQ